MEYPEGWLAFLIDLKYIPVKMERETEAGQLLFVAVDYRAPIRGRLQKEAYLSRYLPPLLEGRLAVPRKNMRLDLAVEDVVEKCLACYPADSEARTGLAIEMVEKSPYPEGKMRALRFLNGQNETTLAYDQLQSQLWQNMVERLIAASDQNGDREIRTALFGAGVRTGRAFVGGYYRIGESRRAALVHPDYFPIFFQSLTGETDQRGFVSKFIGTCRYLHVISLWNKEPQEQAERLSSLMEHFKGRVKELDQLEAVDLIFSVLEGYTLDCLRGVIFVQPPLDLKTLLVICREAPTEQRAEVVRRVQLHLRRLTSECTTHNMTQHLGPDEAREALINSVFPVEVST